jgi:hypothetical protein
MKNFSFNSSTVVDTTECYQIFFYPENVLNTIGIVTNSICIFIFAVILKKERQNSNMFRYFFVKTVNDLVYIITLQFTWLDLCSNCPITFNYIFNLFKIFFYWYVSEVTMLTSGLLELAATLDCYNLLSNKSEYLKTKKAFYVAVISIFVFCSSFLCFFILRWEIIHNSLGYTFKKKDDHIYSVLFYINIIIRDYIVLLMLMILNILVLYQMKRSTRLRKFITNNIASVLVKQAQKAENNKVKMILAVGSSFFLLHFLDNLEKFFKISEKFKCFDIVAVMMYNITYYNSIIFYMLFNNTFRKAFVKYFTFQKLRLHFSRN